MGCFLLNEMGEVLLELVSGLNFAMDMRLEINEGEQSAVLKSGNESVEVGFVHEDLMLALKMRRYLFVAERNNAFFLKNSKLAKVVFVG
ncbi:MAG: hypothetical protein J6B00_02920 [Alphaproteobacteria bacterium]|nr:hypothetical protein [Alphaproteobacteria bacterium]MBP3686995.1 hypothetical protein [Alphaproteobacteria bacterium]